VGVSNRRTIQKNPCAVRRLGRNIPKISDLRLNG